jgi:hypothetical protein
VLHRGGIQFLLHWGTVKHKDKMALMPFFFNMLDSVSRILALPNPVRNDGFLLFLNT